MRKCDACGYRLFGDGETCNHCGAALAAVTAGAPASVSAGSQPAPPPPVAPPAPRFPTAPPPPAPVAPAGPQFAGSPTAPHPGPPGVWTPNAGPLSGLAPPPVGPPPSPGFGRTAWQPAPPVVINTAPARSTRTGRVALIIVLLLVVGGIGGALYMRAHAVPAGTSAFVDGHGIEYTSADRTYSAQLPKQPTVQQQPVQVGPYTGTMSLAIVQADDYELGTASMPMPVDVPADRVDAALDDSLTGGLASVSDGKPFHARHFMRGGYPAADVSFTAKDGYSAHALVMLGGNTVFIMFSHAKTGANALFKALDKSFKVNGGF